MAARAAATQHRTVLTPCPRCLVPLVPQACLTADEDFPAFILNTFRGRYKVHPALLLFCCDAGCAGRRAALAPRVPPRLSARPLSTAHTPCTLPTKPATGRSC